MNCPILCKHFFIKWLANGIDKKTLHDTMMTIKLGRNAFGGIMMDKEEILAKSRKESKDEGIEYAKNKGRGIGLMAMSAMFIALIIYNLVKGLNNYAIFALFWIYLGFESYGRYRFTKGKAELIGAAAGIITGVAFFILYIIETTR